MLLRISKFIYEYILNFIIRIVGIVMSLCVVVQIACRYIPGLNWPWTEELARFTFIWFSLVAIAMAYHKGQHMSINYFVLKFNIKIQQGLNYFIHILIFLSSTAITFYGIRLSFMSAGLRSPILDLSYFWFFMSVPAGFSFVALFSFFDLACLVLKNSDRSGEK
jgi:TRAP-type C4-dicarboxylate transport system permease small subunit